MSELLLDDMPPLPVVTYRVRACCWVLEVGYHYDDGTHLFRIPRGFVFDLASIPRLAWWLIAPFELSIAAPLIHDYLYRHGGVPPLGPTLSRRDADRLFRRMMEREGVPRWRRVLAYPAVRLFGWVSWRKHLRRVGS
jgi:hypothetical protein